MISLRIPPISPLPHPLSACAAHRSNHLLPLPPHPPSSLIHMAASSSSPRSGSLLYYAGCEEYIHETYFLEACFICQKPLGKNTDIFMYRGNTPFCSKECRQEQMEFDEAKEKSWKMRSSVRKSDSNKSSSANKTVHTDTVAVA